MRVSFIGKEAASYDRASILLHRKKSTDSRQGSFVGLLQVSPLQNSQLHAEGFRVSLMQSLRPAVPVTIPSRCRLAIISLCAMGMFASPRPVNASQTDLGDSWSWRNPVSPLGTGSNSIKKAITTASGTVIVGRRGMILVNGVMKLSLIHI